MVATTFTPALQGYYYTFFSLMALQVFIELGLGVVVIQFASHEWTKLRLNRSGAVEGDERALSRLRSIAVIALKWHFVGALVFGFGLTIGGLLFFARKSNADIYWSAPWIALCLMTAVILFLMPVWSLLEGCNQVAQVYRYRLAESLVRSLSLWGAILLGAGLWALPIAGLACLLWGLIFLVSKYRRFFLSLRYQKSSGEPVRWSSEMFPMQWRIAVSWLSGYFVFSTFTPILFQYHGPIVAGQMGLTWSLAGLLTSFSMAWINPKAPVLGMLAAKRDRKAMDRLLGRLTQIILAVSVLGALLLFLGVVSLHELNIPLSQRILGPLPTGLFLLATILVAVSMPFSAYLRAHKKEPIMMLSVAAGLLVAISNLTLGKQFSATGMAFGYLATNAIIIPLVIYTWCICRKKWYGRRFVETG